MAVEGRPPLFSTDTDLILAVENYFEHIKGERGKVTLNGVEVMEWTRMPEPATITGLALFLGFESRQSIYDYAEKGEFSYIIKNARLRVESQYERNLHGTSPTGSIFALKNMGWKDKTETDITTGGESLNFAVTLNLGGQPTHSEPVPGQQG